MSKGQIDVAVEHAGRWTAGRMSRRSLLGRIGKIAVLVAGGPTIVALLADPAGARVCGQTGVSPACPTFDCDDIWGWCWYATGCCSDGLLKKICDCCAVNWPNVHGYCPDGTNVKCIVESCGTDPRVQTAPVTRIATDDYYEAAGAIRARRFPGGSDLAVVGDAASPAWAAVSIPVAAALGAPLLTTSMGRPDGELLSILRSLRSTRVVISAPHVPTSVDELLRAEGYTVERLGSSHDLPAYSAEVAGWMTGTGATGAVVVSSEGLSAQATPLAAALAARLRWPVLVDPAGPVAGLPVITVGPEAAGLAGGAARVHQSTARDIVALANELVDLSDSVNPLGSDTVVVAPKQTPILLALAHLGLPLVLTEHDTLDGGRERVQSRVARYRIAHAILGGPRWRMGEGTYRELQSIVNGFAVDKLIGVAGQGLPVWQQPAGERPVGMARLGTDPPPATGRYSTPPAPTRRRTSRRRVVRRRRRR